MLSAADIRRHFELLDAELRTEGILGELYLVGGAVMCLVFNARPSTNDVDAYLVPSRALREAAMRVGVATGAGSKWLNDAVKGFLSQHGDFDPFLDLPNLKVFTARAEYLFAMKCVALRVGAEFHDVDDVRYLIRHLGISELTEAFAIIERYYPPDRIPPKTRFALEELLGDRPTSRAIRLDLE